MFNPKELAFDKYADGLMPAVVQDNVTGKVLMVGFMNNTALHQTLASQKITFFSRSKQKLWTKGETSGNYLHLVSIASDCDNDTLLLKAKPDGPACHTGADTCFNEINLTENTAFLQRLEQIIADRKANPTANSYISSLFAKGINKVAQKVGEEAVELVIEAKDNDESLFLNEAADLLFHYLVLLQAKGYTLQDVTQILSARHK